MKNQTSFTLSVLIIWLISGCSDPQKDTSSSITFSIEGFENDTIRLWQPEHLSFSIINSQELILDESGFGEIDLTYPDNSFVFLKIGNFVFPSIHVEGSDLTIKGNVADLSNTIEISGKGSLPNNYLQAKKAIIRKYNNLNGRLFFRLDSSEFWDRISALNTEIDSLNNWLATQRIDRKLEALLSLESQQPSNAYILNYALVKGYKSPRYSVDIPYDQNLFMSHSTAYSMVLGFNYEFQLMGPIWVNSGASNSDSIAYIFPQVFTEALDTIGIPDYAKDYYLARLLASYFRAKQSNPVLEDVYAKWRIIFPNSTHRIPVAEAYKGMSNLAPGTRAPIITGIDQNGMEFSTEQLKGHFIYIDVWATWCSPCREKLPKMYSLQKDFEDNSQIKFLFVSIDKDLDKWQNYISKLPADGLHINSSGTRFWQDYMINGIPHYIIIDPSGKIYESDAPDPDSEAIKSILKRITDIAS